ncbi:MAG: hypothetical protein MHM6MM_002135 [Cercozoa sp. M6MM]
MSSPTATVNVIEAATDALSQSLAVVLQNAFGVEKSPAELARLVQHGQKKELGELAIVCARLSGVLKKKPLQAAEEICEKLQERLVEDAELAKVVESFSATGPFVNVKLSTSMLGQIMDAIHGGWTQARGTPVDGPRQKVMVEYSQPNTHKAFHVGHMRNAALGDVLSRLYEHVGHEVLPVNYFGDEGQHIAKCLWLLKQKVADGVVLEDVPKNERANFLGDCYVEATCMLALDYLTKFALPGAVAARVDKIEAHPNAEAPANWHLVTLTVDAEGNTAQVVCGGAGYQVGDLVAYMPVGGKFKGINVAPKDMLGVDSCGIMLGFSECSERAPDALVSEVLAKLEAEEPEALQALLGAGQEEASKKKKKKKKKAVKPEDKLRGKLICVLSHVESVQSAQVGDELIEVAKVAEHMPGTGERVSEVHARWRREVGELLRAMEDLEPEAHALWKETRQWSLDEFAKVYEWLGCRFAHDFFESEVSEQSKEVTYKYLEKGVFVRDQGAVGADLSKYKLPFCLLIKSNGAGLYATKDLALASRKFEQFGVDKSIYVVDSAQEMHFKQVFACLDLMGYEQAKQCAHKSYGRVTLANGVQMATRANTVIKFRALKDMLEKYILEEFFAKKDEEGAVQHDADGNILLKEGWTQEEVDEAVRKLCVATIRHGMLNHDTNKDIAFVMEKWASVQGNTGPYLLYAYARIQSMMRQVLPLLQEDAHVDPSLLVLQKERALLWHLGKFWEVVEKCASAKDPVKASPSALCDYLFETAQMFSSWYNDKEHDTSIKNCKDPNLQKTRAVFVQAVARVLQDGMALLGIDTLDRM